MNINQIKASAISQYQATARVSRVKSPIPVQEPDSFVISNDTKIYSEAYMTLKKMLQAENINAAKISQLKTEIEKGTYSVDPSAVADKILG